MLELLVVMTMMGVLLSFVAPLSLEKLQIQQRRNAFDAMAYWLKTQAEIAQVNGCGNQLTFIGRQITYLENCSELLDRQPRQLFQKSKELSFSETTLVLNKYGVYTPSSIQAWYEDAQYVLYVNTGEFSAFTGGQVQQ